MVTVGLDAYVFDGTTTTTTNWFALGFLEALECGNILMEGLDPPSVTETRPERFLGERCGSSASR